jgi:hypothetical protein
MDDIITENPLIFSGSIDAEAEQYKYEQAFN